MALRVFRRRPTALAVLEGIDLSGKVMLVTGGDGGIGFETTRALALRGARVYVGCLAKETGERAAATMRAEHPSADVRPIAFDLGDLPAVREAARTLDEPALHAVICNAGVYGGPYATTKQGFERTFGVCYLGHAALVLALEERLVRGAPSRVVIVSSDNHRWPPTLEREALPTPRDRYTELRAYGQAKLSCVMLAKALDARWSSRGVHAYSLHPGDLVSTGIDKDSWVLRTVMFLAKPISPSAAQAAATSVWAATTPALADRGGGYYVDCEEVSPSPAALVHEDVEWLWNRTVDWLARDAP